MLVSELKKTLYFITKLSRFPCRIKNSGATCICSVSLVFSLMEESIFCAVTFLVNLQEPVKSSALIPAETTLLSFAFMLQASE